MAEVEVLRAEMTETDVTVEGEYMSEDQMAKEGISEPIGSNLNTYMLSCGS